MPHAQKASSRATKYFIRVDAMLAGRDSHSTGCHAMFTMLNTFLDAHSTAIREIEILASQHHLCAGDGSH